MAASRIPFPSLVRVRMVSPSSMADYAYGLAYLWSMDKGCGEQQREAGMGEKGAKRGMRCADWSLLPVYHAPGKEIRKEERVNRNEKQEKDTIANQEVCLVYIV